MNVAWLLYYAMVISHLCGLTYVIFKGGAVHRIVALVIAAVAALQISACAAAVCTRTPIREVRVSIDILDNAVLCLSLLTVAFVFKRSSWIIGLLMLAAVQLALDGFFITDDSGFVHPDLPGVANVISISMVGLLVFASARRIVRGYA